MSTVTGRPSPLLRSAHEVRESERNRRERAELLHASRLAARTIMTNLMPLSQNLQGAIDRYREVSKRWDDRLALHQRSFAEYYREGSAALLYKLELSARPSNPGDPIGGELCSTERPFSALAVLRKKTLNPADTEVGDQQFVFVDVVELLEGKEHVTIPSLVRLYLIDHERSDGGQERLVWSFAKRLFEVAPRGIDWELFLPVSYRLPANFSPKVVECRTQVVQGIAEREAHFDGKFLDCFNPNEVIQGILATVDGNVVDTRITKCPQVGFKVVDVLLGPFEL